MKKFFFIISIILFGCQDNEEFINPVIKKEFHHISCWVQDNDKRILDFNSMVDYRTRFYMKEGSLFMLYNKARNRKFIGDCGPGNYGEYQSEILIEKIKNPKDIEYEDVNLCSLGNKKYKDSRIVSELSKKIKSLMGKKHKKKDEKFFHYSIENRNKILNFRGRELVSCDNWSEVYRIENDIIEKLFK